MAVPRELLAGTYHQPHTERCEHTTDKEGRRREMRKRETEREEEEKEEVEDRRVEQRER
jgi:hypothetical protein